MITYVWKGKLCGYSAPSTCKKACEGSESSCYACKCPGSEKAGVASLGAQKPPFRPTQCFLQNLNELCHCLPRGTPGTPGTIFTCSSMTDDHESIWGLWNKTMNHLSRTLACLILPKFSPKHSGNLEESFLDLKDPVLAWTCASVAPPSTCRSPGLRWSSSACFCCWTTHTPGLVLQTPPQPFHHSRSLQLPRKCLGSRFKQRLFRDTAGATWARTLLNPL